MLDGQAIFETVISAVMWLLGFLASLVIFYAYLIQKFVVYVAYGLAPIFIGFLAVRTLNSIGVNFLLGFVGVLCWPLGWGAASLLTAGLIDFMTDQSFLIAGGSGAAVNYGLQNLMGLAALALWILVSTIAAPLLIQKAISTGALIGGALLAAAASAGSAGLSAGAGVASAAGGGGGLARTLSGAAGGAVAATVGAADAAAGGGSYSPLGSLLGSLAAGQRAQPKKSPSPKKDDPTGDRAVSELIGKARN